MENSSFPQLSGKLVNLRESSRDDVTNIVNLMSYDIAKYLYEVPHPYKIDDALKFIKSSCDDFRLHNSITFAIDYKNKSFDVLELKEISAYVFPENKPSIRVLEKNGFVKTKKVNEYHPISNSYRNSLVYIIKNKMSISS